MTAACDSVSLGKRGQSGHGFYRSQGKTWAWDGCMTKVLMGHDILRENCYYWREDCRDINIIGEE